MIAFGRLGGIKITQRAQDVQNNFETVCVMCVMCVKPDLVFDYLFKTIPLMMCLLTFLPTIYTYKIVNECIFFSFKLLFLMAPPSGKRTFTSIYPIKHHLFNMCLFALVAMTLVYVWVCVCACARA